MIPACFIAHTFSPPFGMIYSRGEEKKEINFYLKYLHSKHQASKTTYIYCPLSLKNI